MAARDMPVAACKRPMLGVKRGGMAPESLSAHVAMVSRMWRVGAGKSDAMTRRSNSNLLGIGGSPGLAVRVGMSGMVGAAGG
ncbi:MAG TPA: hypothetical protein VGL93_10370 [Streptosporangiaceae bacterium]|jgi:hypothetical protein